MDVTSDDPKELPGILNTLVILLAIFVFFFAIQLMGSSFYVVGQEFVSFLDQGTRNPFIGLFIGLLVTAILQSSSTTTSISVAAVATGSLDLSHAIPIIMGANMGTTITSTIVALGYITKASEFRKAVSAATLHDLFNILSVLIIFPLELNYQILQRASSAMAASIPISSGTIGIDNFLGFISSMTDGVVAIVGPIIGMVLAISVLFGTIKVLSNILYNRLIGKRRQQLQNLVFRNRFRAFGWGLLFTAAVQSSSLTTSLIVPLVATGRVRLYRAFQFLMGANIGTTLTAILAAVFRSEEALSLAFAHFLFNFLAVGLFSIIPLIGQVPVFIADKLGQLSLRYRLTAFVYITLTFFVIPFTLIYFSSGKADLGTRNTNTDIEVVTQKE